MKLLFDHHLSRKLVTRLADICPAASHVVFHGVDRADDIVIWRFAQEHQFTIVTKDADFNDVATLRGAPPEIVWLRVGNCATATVANIIRNNTPLIEQFIAEPTGTILEIIA